MWLLQTHTSWWWLWNNPFCAALFPTILFIANCCNSTRFDFLVNCLSCAENSTNLGSDFFIFYVIPMQTKEVNTWIPEYLQLQELLVVAFSDRIAKVLIFFCLQMHVLFSKNRWKISFVLFFGGTWVGCMFRAVRPPTHFRIKLKAVFSVNTPTQ